MIRYRDFNRHVLFKYSFLIFLNATGSILYNLKGQSILYIHTGEFKNVHAQRSTECVDY